MTRDLPPEYAARLREDVDLWPPRIRWAYLELLREAAAAGESTALGSPAESDAREQAEMAAGWHRGWPKRGGPGGGEPSESPCHSAEQSA